jgi:hypothetical protein
LQSWAKKVQLVLWARGIGEDFSGDLIFSALDALFALAIVDGDAVGDLDGRACAFAAFLAEEFSGLVGVEDEFPVRVATGGMREEAFAVFFLRDIRHLVHFFGHW